MTQCCAPDCKNKGRHIFPKDSIRRKSWEKALRIKKFKATEHSVLCSAHFKADDYFGQSKYTAYEPQAKFLKKTAVPSIFSFTKTKLESTSAKERLERFVIKRSQRKLMLDVPKSLTKSSQESSETCLPISREISAESEEISLSASPAEHVFLSTGTQVILNTCLGQLIDIKLMIKLFNLTQDLNPL